MELRRRLGDAARRLARIGYVLLVGAAGLAIVGGLVLALGQPRAHTLIIYAAVALATVGVLLALPAALGTNPLSTEEES